MARDPQNLHGPALLYQCPQNAPQFPQSSLVALSLLRSYRGLTVGDQSNATSILPSSQLPRRLRCRHGLRLKRDVSGSRYGHPRAQLVSSLLHHHTSPSLRLLPGRTRVKDTPLLFRLLSAKCFRGISARGSKTFWHLCLQLSLLVLCLSSLSATSLLLSPMAAPSIYHTGIELRRHACRRLSPVHDCMTASEGVLLSVPDIILAGLSWVRSSFSLLVLEIQGHHAGAAYSSKLP